MRRMTPPSFDRFSAVSEEVRKNLEHEKNSSEFFAVWRGFSNLHDEKDDSAILRSFFCFVSGRPLTYQYRFSKGMGLAE
jgi:hypothetical protein